MMRRKNSSAQLLINNSEITYKIRYSKKAKYLQLRISHLNQLELIIPKGYSLREGERFIHTRIDWIRRHHKYLITLPDRDNTWLFGNRITIEQTFDLFLKKHKIKLKNNILKIESPAESRIKIEDIYYSYLKKISKDYIPKRVKYLSEKFNFKFQLTTIRGQRTRWGSCSSKGHLSFNYKLMKFRKEVIDYVIIHELCHTKEMNHSKRFWKLVEECCPDYKILKKELKGENLRG